MDEEKLKEWRRQALGQASKKRLLAHEAEDFASFAVMKKAEGSKSSVAQLWVIYLRDQYGDMRCKYRQEQRRLSPKPLTERSVLEAKERADAGVDWGVMLRFVCNDGSVWSQRDRAMIKLKYEWEFTEKEIADAFGIDLSLVYKNLKEIEGRMRSWIEARIGGRK